MIGEFGSITKYSFDKKWAKGVDDSTIDDMTTDICGWLALINEGTTQYLVNDTDRISVVKRCTMDRLLSKTWIMDLDYEPPKDRGRGRPRLDEGNISLASCVDTLIQQGTISYAGVEFTTSSPRDGYINLFKGYKATVRDTYNRDRVKVVQDYILGQLVNGDDRGYTYVTQWLSHALFNPSKLGVALFFIGEQGVGKTLLCTMLMKHIIGEDICFMTDGLDDVTDRYNGVLTNTKAVFVNEVMGCSKGRYQRLKSLLTDEYISIETKGVDRIQMRSSHVYILSSNYPDQFFIEDKDRRFAIFQCGSKKDKDYYIKVANAFEDGRDDIITWLHDIYDPTYDISKFPTTDLKTQMIKDNRHHIVVFLEDEDIESGEHECDDIYTDYKKWCINNGITPVSKLMMCRLSQGHIKSLGRNSARRTIWKVLR